MWVFVLALRLDNPKPIVMRYKLPHLPRPSASRAKKLEGAILLSVFFVVFLALALAMGVQNLFNTLMQTAYSLLMESVFYIMAITVLSGAISRVFVEFGVIGLIESMLKPLMKPIYNLPGVASLGGVLTFFADNPAIISLAKDRSFAQYFKKYQFISLANFGTSFGMGLVVLVFLMGQGSRYGIFIGLLGAFLGSIVSTRLMQYFVLKNHPELDVMEDKPEMPVHTEANYKEGLFIRFLNAVLDGGKTGVEVGLAIIPGVLIISTFVMLLTFGMPEGGYTGAAYEGVPVLTFLASKVDFLFKWLFGFVNPELISFPITALGSVGAAIGLIPKFAEAGFLDENAMAVLTAFGMSWSGYLSTYTAMMDAIGYRQFTTKAILAHTIGGISGAIFAHWVFVLVTALFS